MSDESSARRTRPLLLLVVSVIFIAVLGWHYLCHLHLETKLETSTNEFLHAYLEGATATVSVHPLTNLVSIQVEYPVRARDEFSRAIVNTLGEYVGRKLEPEIERALATAARADTDFYAMAVPYHVSIDVTDVRVGFFRIVQDVQKELVRLGYDIGEADGINGARTKWAIAHVQTQLRRAQDGQASPELLSVLRDSKPAPPSRSLEPTREH